MPPAASRQLHTSPRSHVCHISLSHFCWQMQRNVLQITLTHTYVHAHAPWTLPPFFLLSVVGVAVCAPTFVCLSSARQTQLNAALFMLWHNSCSTTTTTTTTASHTNIITHHITPHLSLDLQTFLYFVADKISRKISQIIRKKTSGVRRWIFIGELIATKGK